MARKISKKDFMDLVNTSMRIIHQNETRRTQVQIQNTIRDLKELASYLNSNSTLEQDLSEKISDSLNDIIPSIRSLDDIETLGSLYNILLRWPVVKIESNQLRESDTFTVMKPKKDVDTGEWVVVVKKNGKRDEGKTYYASDKEDADGTRKLMLKELGLSESIPERIAGSVIDERRHKKNQLTGKKLTQNLIFQLNGRIAGVAANLNGLIKTIEDLQTQDLEGLDSLQAGLSRVVAQLNTASQTFDGNSGTKSKIAELVDEVRKW